MLRDAIDLVKVIYKYRSYLSKIKTLRCRYIYLFILISAVLSAGFTIGYLMYKEPPVKATFRTDLSSSSWERNQTYTFEVLLESEKPIYTENVVYIKPNFKNTTPPVALNYADSAITNKVGDLYNEIVKGIIDTSKADAGTYNLCILAKDRYHTEQPKIVDYCSKQQISIK